jgi:hypothetical protein
MIKELNFFLYIYISSNTLFIIAYNIINDVALPLTINCGDVIVFFLINSHFGPIFSLHNSVILST